MILLCLYTMQLLLLHVPHCFSDQLMCMTYYFCSKPLSNTKKIECNVTRQTIRSAEKTRFSKCSKDGSPSINQSTNTKMVALLKSVCGQLRRLVCISITTGWMTGLQEEQLPAQVGSSDKAQERPLCTQWNRSFCQDLWQEINSWDSTLETTKGLT